MPAGDYRRGRIGQHGCAGPDLWLSPKHPELARDAAGPEPKVREAKRPGPGGRAQAGRGRRCHRVPVPSGSGAIGFWGHRVLGPSGFGPRCTRYRKTRVPHCSVHKTANVLNAVPRSVQPKAKADLKDIWLTETKADANADAAFDGCAAACRVKYHRAVRCRTKDRADRLAFCDFPGRALEAHPDQQPDREHLCHRPTPNHQDQRLPEPPDRTGDATPADAVRQAELAQPRRSEPAARDHRWD